MPLDDLDITCYIVAQRESFILEVLAERLGVFKVVVKVETDSVNVTWWKMLVLDDPLGPIIHHLNLPDQTLLEIKYPSCRETRLVRAFELGRCQDSEAFLAQSIED